MFPYALSLWLLLYVIGFTCFSYSTSLACSRRNELPALGDGVCHALWNCADYAYDDGNCVSEAASNGMSISELKLGTARWDDAKKKIVIYIRKDMKPSTKYAFRSESCVMTLVLTCQKVFKLPTHSS